MNANAAIPLRRDRAFGFEGPGDQRPEIRPARSPQSKGQPVVIDRITKAFGDRRVLSGIDLAIEAGEFVAIVGRSGCGKSTLLRLIAGLDRSTEGRIVVGDRIVEALEPSIRLLFQDARLLPWQRVIGNVGIARTDGWRKAAASALDDVGLGDRADDWPSVLSGGQRQRVALARALITHPGVLLLDEPFGALDALTRGGMHRLLERIWHEHGFTTVLITHDVSEALRLADRVIVLRDGGVALDVKVGLARSRRDADDAETAELRARILDEV